MKKVHSKSVDWFLHDNDLRHERVKVVILLLGCYRIKL